MTKKCPLMMSTIRGFLGSYYSRPRDKEVFEECYGEECMAYKDGECIILTNDLKDKLKR